jgi:hypothetical protein
MQTRRLQDPEALAQRLRDEHIEILVVESDFVFEEIFEGAADLNFVGVCGRAAQAKARAAVG